MQTKTQSAVEVVCSTVVAFAISVCAGQFIYPAFGMPTTWVSNAGVTATFTVISIIRSYVSRRFFNWLHGR